MKPTKEQLIEVSEKSYTRGDVPLQWIENIILAWEQIREVKHNGNN